GQAFHVRLHPGVLQEGDRGHRGRGRPLVHREEEQPSPSGAPPSRRGGPGDQRRGEGRPGKSSRRGVPRHRHPARRGDDQAPSPPHVPPVQGAGRRRPHHHPRGGGPHRPPHPRPPPAGPPR